jgi:Cellulase (glycosyl hydrolase family 5)
MTAAFPPRALTRRRALAVLALAASAALGLAVGSAPASAATNTVTVSGGRVMVNGKATELKGIRVASAAIDATLTAQLIGQLDTYKSYGVNAVTVNYMGSAVSAKDPFSADGKTIDSGVGGRMKQIVAAADARGMVVVVAIFYQGAKLKLANTAAVREAVKTVARELKPYGNVIINIANEQNSSGYADTAAIYDFRVPEQVLQLCDLYRTVDPARVVGAGGYLDASNKTIGADPRSAILLFNQTSLTKNSGTLFDAYVAAGVKNKPMLNVEIFGGAATSKSSSPRGNFPDTLKAQFRKELDVASARPGLGVFFHSNPWTQTAPVRYDLGGAGTAADPGIRWWFEYAKTVTG